MKTKAEKIMRGSRLQNGTGAIVLEKKALDQVSSEDYYNFIVLCIIPRQRQYVTWWMNQEGQTFHGHYTLRLEDALKDFRERR